MYSYPDLVNLGAHEVYGIWRQDKPAMIFDLEVH